MITKLNIDPGLSERDGLLKFKPPVTVIVKGHFDETMSDKFNTDINLALATGQEVIPVIIESYGGAVYSLMAMLDSIKSCPIPVATIIKGKAMSCGSVLAAAGTKGFRFISPLSTMMIHEVATGDWAKIAEFKATAAQADALNNVLFKMLDRFGGQKTGYFKKLVHNNSHADLFLNADEAIKHGLADHKAVPNWQIDIKYTRKMVW